MFSTKGGLYERAQKRFNVSNGKRLFTYSFYEKRKLEALVRIQLMTVCTVCISALPQDHSATSALRLCLSSGTLGANPLWQSDVLCIDCGL